MRNERSDNAPAPPLCPSCAQTMRLARITSRFGDLPDLLTFECRAYGVSLQLKNPDGTWAVLYKDLAAEFGVSRCLISKIAQRAGLARREHCRQHIPFVRKRYQPPAQLWDMYQELRGKVGATEARHLIEDHMRIRGISYEHVGGGSSINAEPIAA